MKIKSGYVIKSEGPNQVVGFYRGSSNEFTENIDDAKIFLDEDPAIFQASLLINKGYNRLQIIRVVY